MTEVKLSKVYYFNEDSHLEKLNRHVRIHTDLMPHQVAAATGCKLEEAMEVLMLLFHLYLAEALLLVYHNDHPNIPAKALNISEGLPSLPFICDVCEKEISNPDELSYDFLFKKKDDIQFVLEKQ
jgi:hypothetical protein